MQNTLIEKNLSKYYHNYYISRTSSGTSALIVILKALTIESQKRSNYSFNSLSSVMFAVNFLGLKPIFVDMEVKYFNMCITVLKKKITKNTLARIGVHCFGLTAAIEALVRISKDKKVFLIEDACLNFGGKFKNKYFGSFGDASILSFGYDKILSEKGGALMVKSKRKFLFAKKFLSKNSEFFDFQFDEKKFQIKFDKLRKKLKYEKKMLNFFFQLE